MVVVRTRTPLCVERGSGMSATLKINGDRGRPTGSTVVLLPGDELCLPGGTVGEEAIVEVDLRGVPSANHDRAVLRLGVRDAENEQAARQLKLEM